VLERLRRSKQGDPTVEASRSLRQRVGVVPARELLESRVQSERLRGIARMAHIADDDAVASLVDALAPGTAVRGDPLARVAAVRTLAAHVGDDDARKALAAVLSQARAGSADQPLDRLARRTAALALARGGNRKAISTLVRAVAAGGRAAEAAAAALRAYPPAELGAFRRGRRSASPRVVALLGQLGDARAIGLLRKQLRSKSTKLRSAAVLALAQIGDAHALPVARSLASKSDLRLALVGAEAMLWLDAPEGTAVLARLAQKPAARRPALTLALRAPAPALNDTAAAVLKATVPAADKELAIQLLGLIDDPRSVPPLLEALADPALSTAAAFALARHSRAAAEVGLRRASETAKDGALRLVLRARVVRALRLRETPAELVGRLRSLLAGKAAADQAAAAFGLAALGADASLLASKYPAVVAAAARGALARGPNALQGCRRHLAKANDSPTAEQIACGVALLSGDTPVATAQLVRWAELGGPLGPLAAYRFATRDSRPFRSRLRRLLAGSDAVVRAHVGLGLGASPEADAAALLTDAYRREPEASVRRALVRALSQRGERLRLAVLVLARDLDPDPQVRALARNALALRPQPVRQPPVGPAVAWVHLRSNDPARTEGLARAGRLRRDDGVALPVVADPDGVLLVPGLSTRGLADLQLAPAMDTEQP
jgi:HEAT repeat protein